MNHLLPNDIEHIKKTCETTPTAFVQVNSGYLLALITELERLQVRKLDFSYGQKVAMAEQLATAYCKEKNLEMAKAVWAAFRAGYLKHLGLSGGIRG